MVSGRSKIYGSPQQHKILYSAQDTHSPSGMYIHRGVAKKGSFLNPIKAPPPLPNSKSVISRKISPLTYPEQILNFSKM